ncbi:hypothetical protein TeGR_g13968 [Tetraparma gracilis]|uniref:Odorant receptor n=1 Tax=Tetraparma gracilis TaxID=2962635 RepID=A0ABQ6MA34_9STRA|nr:hypothetical protein TeGR_g13968 [Tetraparma gracilis]
MKERMPRTLMDRAHAARLSYKDLRPQTGRQLNAPHPSATVEAESSNDEIFEVPPFLSLFNRIARIFSIGCSQPAQPKWYKPLVLMCLATMALYVLVALNSSREAGNIGPSSQIGLSVIVCMFVVQFVYAASNSPFDNVFIHVRKRTIHYLDKEGRPDLVEKVDETIQREVRRRIFILPIVHTTVATIVANLHVFRDWDSAVTPMAVSMCFSLMQLCAGISAVAWSSVVRLHAIQIEGYHDSIVIAFTDLSRATVEAKEAQKTGASTKLVESVLAAHNSRETGRRASARATVEELTKQTEFFDEQWVIERMMAFVDIGKSMNTTNSSIGERVGKMVVVLLAAAGFMGLSLLMTKVTVEEMAVTFFILVAAVQTLMVPLVANDELHKLRELAWHSYGELMTHSLLFKSTVNSVDGFSEVDDTNVAQYKQTINGAAHLLNIIQTSREGMKYGDVECSREQVKTLLRTVFSAAAVIARASDTTGIEELFLGGGGGNATAVEAEVVSP